ncbi:hypothetical protein EON64_17435, partial [archaeon]
MSDRGKDSAPYSGDMASARQQGRQDAQASGRPRRMPHNGGRSNRNSHNNNSNRGYGSRSGGRVGGGGGRNHPHPHPT